MSSRPWYKRYGADFVHGTLGLTLEEKGAYSLCLDLIYDRGGPIPDDARWLAGVCGVSVRKWNAIRDRLVDVGKLGAEGGFLTNTRAEREIAIAAKTARKLAENGSKGGNKRAENERGARNNNNIAQAGLSHRAHKPEAREDIEEPNGSLSETDVSDAQPATPEKRRKRVAYPPDFEAFWSGYPTDALMSKKDAGRVWSRMAEDDRRAAISSLAAFRAHCLANPDYRPVHANRYLSQERFVGFNAVVLKAAGKVFVAKDTPEWDAWQAVKKTPCAMSQEHRKDGWWFESRWPSERSAA